MSTLKGTDYISIVISLDDEIRSNFYLITDSEIIFLDSLKTDLRIVNKTEYLNYLTFQKLSEHLTHILSLINHYKKLYSNIHFKIDFILPRPLAYTISKNILYRTPVKTKITQEILSKLLLEIKDDFVEKYQDKYKAIDEKIHATKIDGYEINDWKDKEAMKFEANIIFTLVNTDFLTFICKELEIRNIDYPMSFHTSLGLTHIHTQDHVKDKNVSYITLFVDKDYSEFISAFNGVPYKSGILDIGYGDIHSQIDNISNSRHLTHSILRIMGDSHDSHLHTKTDRNKILQIFADWKKKIFSLLTRHLESKVDKIFIYSKDHLDHEMSENIFDFDIMTIVGDYDRQKSSINIKTENIYFPKHIDAVFVRTIHNL